jgi:hypothetical protein
MVINLQVGTGGATKQFLDPTQNNTDIPVYVYATVTGANAVNDGGSGPPPANISATTGNFQGVQYLYYNVLNSGTHPITGGVGNGTLGAAPQLNATVGFNANGSSAGKVQNLPGGISIGSGNTLADIPKPRSARAIWDNANNAGSWYGNDGKQIVLSNSNKSVSFLVETFYFHPTAFTPGNTSQTNNTTFTISVPNLLATTGFFGAGANWMEDNTTLPSSSNNPPQSTQNGAYTAGTSVTFTDTMLGDTDDNGNVNVADLANLAGNFGATAGKSWSQGDFDGNGTVNVADLADLSGNFGNSLNGTPTSVQSQTMAPGALEAIGAADPSAMPTSAAAAVPEPAGLLVVGLAGSVLVGHRRRKSSIVRALLPNS